MQGCRMAQNYRSNLSALKTELRKLQLQETQLSLSNRATRLEVSQGHQARTIRYVRYGFLLV